MTLEPPVLSAVSLAVVLLLMLAELQLSRVNERALRQRGAVEPADEVYRTMRWAYPVLFVAMAIEGAIWGWPPGATTVAGVTVFVLSKMLKFWAIASLGFRWTYRVFVLPGAPLVTRGPYAFMRHPNYVAVVGEIVGMALLVGARMTGPIAIIGFGSLLRRRIRAEERALGVNYTHGRNHHDD
jgi:methyltransferase